MGALKNKINSDIKKLFCPFNKRCFTDSTICGYIGYYVDCPTKAVTNYNFQNLASGNEN